METLLKEITEVDFVKNDKTIMEITRFPHYENINSNILQFYLDPKNEHGLGSIVLKAFLEMLNLKIQPEKISEVEVLREVSADKQKRIDLIILTKGYCVAVENKIFHELNNDLTIYSSKIDEICNNGSREVKKIVLSLNAITKKEEKDKMKINKFENFLHLQLVEKLEAKIEESSFNSNSKYLIFLKDFMKTIRNLTNSNMENKNLWRIIDKNYNSVKELNYRFSAYKESQLSRINNLKNRLMIDSQNVNEWIYDAYKDGFDGYALVYDFKVDGENDFAIEMFFNHEGWLLRKAMRSESNRANQKKHTELMKHSTGETIEIVAESLKNVLQPLLLE